MITKKWEGMKIPTVRWNGWKIPLLQNKVGKRSGTKTMVTTNGNKNCKNIIVSSKFFRANQSVNIIFRWPSIPPWLPWSTTSPWSAPPSPPTRNVWSNSASRRCGSHPTEPSGTSSAVPSSGNPSSAKQSQDSYLDGPSQFALVNFMSYQIGR